METIELVTEIAAPVRRCFELSLSIDLHIRSTSSTGERAVAGVTSGQIGLGQTVTWRAKHFGVWQHFTSKITALEAPLYFRDVMIKGAFRRFEHDHRFAPTENGTRMSDVVVFEAPVPVLGRIAERWVLTDYLRALLIERNAFIKHTAETEAYREFVSE
jgi:ligand-binding SRPBCC domain-containing protein